MFLPCFSHDMQRSQSTKLSHFTANGLQLWTQDESLHHLQAIQFCVCKSSSWCSAFAATFQEVGFCYDLAYFRYPHKRIHKAQSASQARPKFAQHFENPNRQHRSKTRRHLQRSSSCAHIVCLSRIFRKALYHHLVKALFSIERAFW